MNINIIIIYYKIFLIIIKDRFYIKKYNLFEIKIIIFIINLLLYFS